MFRDHFPHHYVGFFRNLLQEINYLTVHKGKEQPSSNELTLIAEFFPFVLGTAIIQPPNSKRPNPKSNASVMYQTAVFRQFKIFCFVSSGTDTLVRTGARVEHWG